MSTTVNPLPSLAETDDWPRRARLFGVTIDVVAMNEAVAIASNWLARPFEQCRYIVTPNVDHVVLLQRHTGLRAAYADAGLVLADGWPVVAAARLLGHSFPERVAGSDFVPALLHSAHPTAPRRVFLLGAAAGVGGGPAAR